MTTNEKSSLEAKLRNAIRHLSTSLLELDPMVDKAPFERVLLELKDCHAAVGAWGESVHELAQALLQLDEGIGGSRL